MGASNSAQAKEAEDRDNHDHKTDDVNDVVHAAFFRWAKLVEGL
jgi:hypothetical protein